MAEGGKLEIKELDPSAGNDPSSAATKSESEESTVLTAYGKETVLQACVTGDEADKLVELAQKGLSSDQRWRESQTATQKAKEDTERAAAGLAVLDAADRLKEDPSDMGAFEVVADAFGYSKEQMAGMAADTQETASGKKGKTDPPPPRSETEAEKWDKLPRDVQKQLKQGFRDRRDDDLKEALAKDAVLGQNNSSESRSATILGMAVDEATRLMVVGILDPTTGRNRILPYGPEVVRMAVDNVRQRIEGLGTHQEVSEQLPTPGAGRAPIGGSSRHTAKKPERVSMTDPGYNEYFQKRLQWEASRTE